MNIAALIALTTFVFSENNATLKNVRLQVILNRMDGSVDFYRSWETYKKGFGKADGEYWLGKNK